MHSPRPLCAQIKMLFFISEPLALLAVSLCVSVCYIMNGSGIWSGLLVWAGGALSAHQFGQFRRRRRPKWRRGRQFVAALALLGSGGGVAGGLARMRESARCIRRCKAKQSVAAANVASTSTSEPASAFARSHSLPICFGLTKLTQFIKTHLHHRRRRHPHQYRHLSSVAAFFVCCLKNQLEEGTHSARH